MSKITTSVVDEENIRKLFPNGVPNDSDIVDLVVRLDSARGGKLSMSAIARKYTGEQLGSDPKAKKLLARIRMMQTRGNLNL